MFIFKLLGFFAGWKGILVAVLGALVAVVVWVKAERAAGYREGQNVCQLEYQTALAESRARHQAVIHEMQEQFSVERDKFLMERQAYDAKIGEIMDGFETPSDDDGKPISCLVPATEHRRLLEAIKARDSRLGLTPRKTR